MVYTKTQDQLINKSQDCTEEQDQHIFFKLIEKVGTFGKYQIMLFTTLCIVGLYTGSVIQMTPFLFYQDNYQCQPQFSKRQCLDLVCSLPPDERKQYIPSSPYIFSFANKYGDYRCPSEQSQLDLIKSIFFSGQLFGFFLCSMIGDLLRSKILMLTGLSIAFTGTLILAFSNLYWLSVTGMLMLTTGVILSFNLTYIFVTQMIEESKRQKFKILIAAMFNIGALFNVLLYYLVPNFKMVLIFFFAIPLLLIAVIFLILFKDTPISMITKNTPEKAYQNLLYIGHFNGKKQVDLSVKQIEQLQNNYRKQFTPGTGTSTSMKKFTVIDLFRYKSLRIMTLILIAVDCVFYLQYLAPTLMLSHFDFDIFLNGAAIESAQVISTIFGWFTVYKHPRRLSGAACFFIIMICSAVLTFIWDQNGQSADLSSSIAVLIFVFLIQLTVSNAFNFYAVYLNQLYPTQVRLIAVGFIKCFGSSTAMISSQIINGCLQSGFKIMLLFTILAAITVVLYYLLPQTHGKRPPEIIEELNCPINQTQENIVQYYKINDSI